MQRFMRNLLYIILCTIVLYIFWLYCLIIIHDSFETFTLFIIIVFYSFVICPYCQQKCSPSICVHNTYCVFNICAKQNPTRVFRE